MSGAGPDPFDLTGRVAMVTGGTRGIGRAIAMGLAAAGAEVAVSSRKPEACAETAAAITAATGRKAHALPANVSRWAECDRLVDEAHAALGRIDILVNNAGASLLYDDITGVSEAMFDKVLGLNPKGPSSSPRSSAPGWPSPGAAPWSTSAPCPRASAPPTRWCTPWPRPA